MSRIVGMQVVLDDLHREVPVRFHAMYSFEKRFQEIGRELMMVFDIFFPFQVVHGLMSLETTIS
jgi:hypothetical protein